LRPTSWKMTVQSAVSIFFIALNLSCRSSPSNTGNPQNLDKPLVDEKYSLTADRKSFDELRKDIPAEKRKENDELALTSSLFADESKSPSQVREKFDSLLRKKRELFQKDMNKLRETYSKEERKRRESFVKQQDEERASFQKKKVTSSERTEFFNELETKRRDYYAEERSKRDEFEETMRDDRKNFDDYTREKSNEFNQEHRAYVKRYEELQKAKAPTQKNP
jgi:hypothetical protein